MVVELLRDDVAIPVGDQFTGLLDNDLRAALLPVDVAENGGLFGSAIDWYESASFRVVQLAYPDPNGWLPWEAGFDRRRLLSQPIIGDVPA